MIQARVLPASRGYAWLLDSLRLYLRNPAILIALTMSYALILVMFSLSTVGQIIIALAQPLLAALIGNVVRQLRQSRQMSHEIFILGIKKSSMTLLHLGGLQVMGTLLVLLIALLLYGVPAKDQDAAFWQLLKLLPLVLPLTLAMWFAPYLANWHGLNAGKSIFFGVVAVLRNWRAFVVFGLGVILWALIIPSAILLLTNAVFGSHADFIGGFIRGFLAFMLGPTLITTAALSYFDVFITEPDTAMNVTPEQAA